MLRMNCLDLLEDLRIECQMHAAQIGLQLIEIRGTNNIAGQKWTGVDISERQMRRIQAVLAR